MMKKSLISLGLLACTLFFTNGPANAQIFGGLRGNRADKVLTPPTLAPGVQRIADIAYGSDPRQRMDVYLPANLPQNAPANAPVILMVHGGAWMVGNKSMPNVVNNKVAHWVAGSGFVVVSVGYRLVPQANPLEQARDVATALAEAQSKAASWGADPTKFILMGHSAGAHLVALLGASPTLAKESGAKPWLGTVALDGAALDVPQLMARRHLPFYDRVFGADPAFWQQVSPISVLQAGAKPMLLVCSTQRSDGSCAQSSSFANSARAQGIQASVLEQNLTHEEVNNQLGLPGAYTEAMDFFIRGLLARPPAAS